MRNTKKEVEWTKITYKKISMSFRRDTESELLELLEQKAKEQGKTVSMYCKELIIKNIK